DSHPIRIRSLSFAGMLALAVFAQTLFVRAIEPLVPVIASEFDVEVTTAALLSSAYIFPYAIASVIFSITSDFLNKIALMRMGLVALAVAALLATFSINFPMLFVARIAQGIAAGAVWPVAIAVHQHDDGGGMAASCHRSIAHLRHSRHDDGRGHLGHHR